MVGREYRRTHEPGIFRDHHYAALLSIAEDRFVSGSTQTNLGRALNRVPKVSKFVCKYAAQLVSAEELKAS